MANITREEREKRQRREAQYRPYVEGGIKRGMSKEEIQKVVGAPYEITDRLYHRAKEELKK